MAPIKTQNNDYSSNYGEAVVRHANVLASCYIVDTAASLKGLHYCSTVANGLPSPPSSPPLAAITSSNELAILPKTRNPAGTRIGGGRRQRRGGATLVIREECVRFFCETMRVVFRGERNMVDSGSGMVTGDYRGSNMIPTPPDDVSMTEYSNPSSKVTEKDTGNDYRLGRASVSGWLEIWDYAGGVSFRGFVAEGDAKALFVFFDMSVLERDLKPSLMALIELAESPLKCSRIVVCIDRRMDLDEAQSLMKSLQWVGFEMATLDAWARQQDVTSENWVFMNMEV